MQSRIENTHVKPNLMPLTPPIKIKAEKGLILEDNLAQQILEHRQSIIDIMDRKNPRRLMVVVGPCSVHNVDAVLKYCERLAPLREKYSKRLNIIVRLHVEKPRTDLGWPGLLLDPRGDGSGKIDEGIRLSRKVMLGAANIGLPVSTEVMTMFSPQYLGDLLSFVVLGARTSESSIHRWLVSGLSAPCGIKNGTGGGIKQAVDGLVATQGSHPFPSINEFGMLCQVQSTGNPNGLLILRGSNDRINYSEGDVRYASKMLQSRGLRPNLIIDSSHGNSGKNPENVRGVCQEVARLYQNNNPIAGLMIESYTLRGAQKLNGKGIADADPEQSITDACVSMHETEQILDELYESVPYCENLAEEAV